MRIYKRILVNEKLIESPLDHDEDEDEMDVFEDAEAEEEEDIFLGL